MANICLISPNKGYEEALQQMKRSFGQSGEPIHGSNGLAKAKTINEWLSQVTKLKDTDQYLIVDEEGVFIGLIDIKKRLNQYTSKEGGHISYSVIKEQQRKGYASQALSLACNLGYDLGIQRLLLTCKEDNHASKRVILKNNPQESYSIMLNRQKIWHYWFYRENPKITKTSKLDFDEK